MSGRILIAFVLSGALIGPAFCQSTTTPSATAITKPTIACSGETDATLPLTVKSTDPCSVVHAVQRAGFQAILTTDAVGDPKINSSANGSKFWILFYGCTDNKNCRSIEFSAGYIAKTKPPLTKTNEWNSSKRFSKAYLDTDGDPHVQFDVAFSDAGMPNDTFGAAIERWSSAMGDFQGFIGW